jgi:hypothetical protein
MILSFKKRKEEKKRISINGLLLVKGLVFILFD